MGAGCKGAVVEARGMEGRSSGGALQALPQKRYGALELWRRAAGVGTWRTHRGIDLWKCAAGVSTWRCGGMELCSSGGVLWVLGRVGGIEVSNSVRALQACCRC